MVLSGSINKQLVSEIHAAGGVAASGYAPSSVAPNPTQTPAYAPPLRREITATAYLIATSGPYTGTAFPIRNGAVVGRDPQAEVPLPADTKASRAHARFVSDGGAFTVEDNNSTNGTFVNGQRVTRQSLVAGDAVQIGATAFRFE